MSAYSASVQADSPYLYYRLGESSGTALADASGNGRGATTSAALPPGSTASLLSADANTSISFDRTGVAGPVLANGVGGSGYDAGAISVEFWCKPIDLTSSGTKAIIASANLGGGSGWHIWFAPATGVWNWTNTGIGDSTFTAAASTGVTQHVVFTTPDYVNISLYIDGVFSQTIGPGTPRSPTGGTTLALVALNDGTQNSRVVLDEFAIYSSVLSAARIAAHFAASSSSATGNHNLGLLGVGT